jgi:hypothetical protein
MNTNIKERPILFTGDMVRAILKGNKTQTRRIVKPQPVLKTGERIGNIAVKPSLEWKNGWNIFLEFVRNQFAPYRVGDRLWVKETFCAGGALGADGRIQYRADYPDGRNPSGLNWKPSIFMPRQASRITLEVLSVRVERVQEISEEDAQAEGTQFPAAGPNSCYRMGYQSLWEKINGAKSWHENPWVWVVEFKERT